MIVFFFQQAHTVLTEALVVLLYFVDFDLLNILVFFISLIFCDHKNWIQMLYNKALKIGFISSNLSSLEKAVEDSNVFV